MLTLMSSKMAFAMTVAPANNAMIAIFGIVVIIMLALCALSLIVRLVKYVAMLVCGIVITGVFLAGLGVSLYALVMLLA